MIFREEQSIVREEELRAAQARAQKWELAQKQIDRIQKSRDKLSELFDRDYYAEVNEEQLRIDLRIKQWFVATLDFLDNAEDFRALFVSGQIENTPDMLYFHNRLHHILTRVGVFLDGIQLTEIRQKEETYSRHDRQIKELMEWCKINLAKYGIGTNDAATTK